jgi:hypothetical protein
MDFNEYALASMLRERHAELLAAARRDALLRAVRPPGRRALRAWIGEVLIRLGARLLPADCATS